MGVPMLPTVESFLYSLFISKSSASPDFAWDYESDSAASDHFSTKKDESGSKKFLKRLKRGDIEEIISWAFFGKIKIIEPWEGKELEKMLESLRTRYGINLNPGRTEDLRTKAYTLQNVTCIHRPLLIYFIFYCLKQVGRVFLRCHGFEYFSTSNGINYWVRHDLPGACGEQLKGKTADAKVPFLFFHGISLGGHYFSLPMILSLCKDRRPIILFEFSPIMYNISFNVPSEEEFVEGVREALDLHFSSNLTFTFCGHSFGTLQLTWLIHAMPKRINQLILLDPVSILMGEPDVMSNFYYHRNLRRSLNNALIHIFVSTEVFIQWYFRRYIYYYNCELWMDDIPEHTKVLVCLSEKDEIMNSPRARNYIMMHNEKQKCSDLPQVDVVYWNDVVHGQCFDEADLWKPIRNFMLKHDNIILKEKSMKVL